MSTRTKLWLVPALLYGIFVFWYTDFSGPLSDNEVDQFVATMKANGSEPETIAFIQKFARQDSGRQFLMVNNIDMNESPPNVEGAEPGESASKLMGRYMAHMIPALLARACHPVLMGSAVYPTMDLVGIEGAEDWDQAALFRYRSRRALLEIVTNPAFNGKHHFKTAALDKTIAYPIETSLYLGDPRLLLGLILLALTALVDGWRLSRRQLNN
ncbi:hypothetical protein EYC87_15275 [Halieaceae bacterium IMCC8485]|jgi:hypothetical protein|uniref:Uncharacterized protein n=1 Tax=Candidatus Seongchinamella marina TaxID=2518990 RepID=A0ABT3SY71_9GAMM|nr:hypothetical protein [Candidatus Seongchinamella marina]MCX2974953.1 hypothetical protein [Candidatus Seongchinamella marina]